MLKCNDWFSIPPVIGNALFVLLNEISYLYAKKKIIFKLNLYYDISLLKIKIKMFGLLTNWVNTKSKKFTNP